jgi:hypothetical protein
MIMWRLRFWMFISNQVGALSRWADHKAAVAVRDWSKVERLNVADHTGRIVGTLAGGRWVDREVSE